MSPRGISGWRRGYHNVLDRRDGYHNVLDRDGYHNVLDRRDGYHNVLDRVVATMYWIGAVIVVN